MSEIDQRDQVSILIALAILLTFLIWIGIKVLLSVVRESGTHEDYASNVTHGNSFNRRIEPSFGVQSDKMSVHSQTKNVIGKETVTAHEKVESLRPKAQKAHLNWTADRIMDIQTSSEFELKFPHAVVAVKAVYAYLLGLANAQSPSGNPQKAMKELVAYFPHFLILCEEDGIIGGGLKVRDVADRTGALMQKYAEFNPQLTPLLQLFWALEDSNVISKLCSGR